MQKARQQNKRKNDLLKQITKLTESLKTTYHSIQDTYNSLAIVLGAAEWIRDNPNLTEKDKNLHLRIIFNSVERIKTILESSEKNILPILTKSEKLSVRPKIHQIVPPKNILIVDDEPDFRIILDRILEKVGYTVMTATNGEEAFQLFTKNRFDLVVTDIRMPKVDGIQLMQQLRDENPWIPIIAISGYETETEINSKIDTKKIYFLRKPFMIKDIEEVINNALNRMK